VHARENTIMNVDLAEVCRCLAALIAAIGAGELVATPVELAHLRGALAAVEHLQLVHNTTL
jgi:hypothetical protein